MKTARFAIVSMLLLPLASAFGGDTLIPDSTRIYENFFHNDNLASTLSVTQIQGNEFSSRHHGFNKIDDNTYFAGGGWFSGGQIAKRDVKNLNKLKCAVVYSPKKKKKGLDALAEFNPKAMKVTQISTTEDGKLLHVKFKHPTMEAELQCRNPKKPGNWTLGDVRQALKGVMRIDAARHKTQFANAPADEIPASESAHPAG